MPIPSVPTFTLCANTPLPDFNQLYQNAISNFTYPYRNFNFPTMPTLPSPMFPTLMHKGLQLVNTIEELVANQIIKTITQIINPIIKFLGMGLDLIPKIPGLPFNIFDLLSGDPNTLYNAVKQAIINKANALWALVPNPMFHSFLNPDIQLVNTVKMLVKGYMSTLVTFITNLINQVVGQLHLPGLPTIPTFPTLQQIYALILAQIPGITIPSIPDFSHIMTLIPDALKKVQTLFANLSIPGFGALMGMLPNPLIPNHNNFEVDFMQALNTLYSKLNNFIWNIIMNFCNTILSMLSFSFPLICISF